MFTAIVRAEGTTGIVVTQLHDFRALDGLRWIRADEITSLDDLEADDPDVRIAELRGWRTEHTDIELTELSAFLAHLAGHAGLVGIYRERTGSDELLVGRIAEVRAGGVRVADVDTNGALTGDEVDVPFEQIIGVDWGTDYLTGLGQLLTSNEAAEHER